MMVKKKKSFLLIILIALPALCLLLLGVSYLGNLSVPSPSASVETLSELDKAHIAEVLHVRQTLGNAVWPGWGDVDIPVLVYNEQYAFLAGVQNPSSGWVNVSTNQQKGTAWELVEGDDFLGQPYNRQLLSPGGATPQAFTVKIGENWVASMPTRETLLISLDQQIRSDFGPVFPHWWFTRQLAGDSEVYIGGLLHESFHAFQGITAGDRLLAGENALRMGEAAYPWEEKTHVENWQIELDTLAGALRAETPEEMEAMVQQFLELRSARRTANALTDNLINLERWREWEEGLAKYTELESLRQAASAPEYAAVDVLKVDPDFHSYRGFQRRWSNELTTLTRQASADENRFYYSGMAQAFLLDRLMPGWKHRAMQENVWLEDLLVEALLKK